MKIFSQTGMGVTTDQFMSFDVATLAVIIQLFTKIENDI